MISYDEANKRILEKASLLKPRSVPIEEANGLILANDVMAPISLPPFSNSAMDGFAVSTKDAPGHLSPWAPGITLPVSQIIRAGDAPRPLEKGTCAKIMTGAPMPEGADAVVPIEDAAIEENCVSFSSQVPIGQYVREAGADIKAGARVAIAGTELTPRQIILFAALGMTRIDVHLRPRVSVVVTGSELSPRGKRLEPGKIYDCNGPALVAALRGTGICADIASVADDELLVTDAINDALEKCDVLITVGGVSVGDYDCVKAALKNAGASLDFWRVAIKPAKPLAFGTLGPKLIFGLPGNPVSCMVAFDLFVRPSISKMMGIGNMPSSRRMAVLSENIQSERGRLNFLRGIFTHDDGRLTVRSSGAQGSSMLKSYADSNCLIIVPAELDEVRAGEEVEIEMYATSAPGFLGP